MALVESFGAEEPDLSGHPRWRPERIEYGPDGTTFRRKPRGSGAGAVSGPPFSGAVNVRNCLAALAAASAVGCRLGTGWSRGCGP